MRKLDPKGRCCGRKPIKYKRDGGPHYFCCRCDRAYSLDTCEQIPNWAWAKPAGSDEFVRILGGKATPPSSPTA